MKKKDKLNRDSISNIINKCSTNKCQARVRDVMFVLLQEFVQDDDIIYKAIFNESNYEEYIANNKEMLNAIRNNVDELLLSKIKVNKVVKSKDSLSFDENKAEMIKLIKATQKAEAAGEIEAKDSLRIQADLRTKINDRFKVAEDSQSNVIVVPKKCNMICEKFRVECYLPTKEDLMEQYGLIEKI